MESSLLTQHAEGEFQLEGCLNLATVTSVLAQAIAPFKEATAIKVDLSVVSQSDSAGLALLVEWMRIAAAANKPISFHAVPKQMLAIARATGLTDILPIKN